MKTHARQFFSARHMIAALCLSLCANFAHAYANYQASASGQLEIYSVNAPGGLSSLGVSGNVFLDNQGTSLYGSADGSNNGSLSIQDGSAGTSPGLLNQSSDVQGYANPTIAGSQALSYHSSEGLFTLTNLSSTDTIEVALSLLYNASVNAAVTRILSESAYTNAFVSLIDNLTGVLLDLNLSADAKGLLGPVSEASGDTLLFTVTLLPGAVDDITLRVGASGSATSIPEPSTIVLLVSGLLGMSKLKHRRRYSVA